MTNAITLKNAPMVNMGNGLELPQLIVQGQPVLTAKAVAEVLGTDLTNIQSRFAYNRKDFKEGVDFIKVSAKEAKAMGFIHTASKTRSTLSASNLFRYSGSGVIVFTRSGAMFMARYVSSPEALALYRNAMDAYFTIEGMAEGTLSVQEGAVKAAEVVKNVQSVLPGIEMQQTGANAPKALEKPLPLAVSLTERLLMELKRLSTNDELNPTGYAAQSLWEKKCREAWEEIKGLKKRLEEAEAESDKWYSKWNSSEEDAHDLTFELGYVRDELATLKVAMEPLQKLLQNQ